MILTREDVKELYGAGSLEVVLAKLPAAELQKVQVAVATPAVCSVRVCDHWSHRSGDYVVILELVKRFKPGAPRTRTRPDSVRLMRRGHGTTSDPRSAMRAPREAEERDGTVPHPDLDDAEAELVDEETERRFAQHAHRSHELRHIERSRRELAERVDRVLEGCERLGVDPTRKIAAFERHLADLEKKLRKAA